MNLCLISCEVFYREMCLAVSRSPNQVDLVFMPKGLHDLGAAPMRERVQAAIDAVDVSNYEALLLGYGLCNNGLAEVRAPAIPLVLPRAHDCITLFLGNRRRYVDYFNANPGTYFKTTGWIERGSVNGELKQFSVQTTFGMNLSYDEMVAKYGEDNAKFLYEELCQHTRNYGQFTFIEMGVEPNGTFERRVKDDADKRGWKYDKVLGDMSLIQRLIDGRWSEDEFLLVPPGARIRATYDTDRIVAVE